MTQPREICRLTVDRAPHDLIAGTAVIYAWDARAARLRFLARQAGIGATGHPRGQDQRPRTIRRG
jgi:hypothetical protein